MKEQPQLVQNYTDWGGLEKKIREEGMEGKMKSKMLVLEITRKRDMRN